MSQCGYYSCSKGIISCKHPDENYRPTSKCFATGGKWNPCEACKRRCGGIYPSQLPKADQIGWQQNVIDKYGNVII